LIFPALSGAKMRAKDAACISNLKQWGIAWRVYADDNNDCFMSGTLTDWPRGEWVLSFPDLYKNHPSLLLCPKAIDRRGPGDGESRTSLDDPNAVDYGGAVTAYDFPVSDPVVATRLLISSYGVNCWIFNPDTNNIQGRQAEQHWRKYGAATQTSITPLFADSAWRGGGPSPTDPPLAYNGQIFNLQYEMQVFDMRRHGKGVNVLFFDSSARNVRAKDLWGLPWSRQYDATAAAGITFPDWMN
jgi:prepilin-type processing-associated H-X9-DG protein